MSVKEVAQAVRDLATLGRLTEESEEAISTILDPVVPDQEESDKDSTPTPNKSTRR